MGLPLAAQFASHGWNVIAVDLNEAVVAGINRGEAHVAEEPGLADRVRATHAAGRLRATTDGAAAARESDVVVLIVPVVLDDQHRPDYRSMDAAVGAIGKGVRGGATVVFETTLPVGATRNWYAPMIQALSGLEPEHGVQVAFSPERLYTGAVFANLATYPKLVGGVGPRSTSRAAAFYASVLDAEIVAMSSAEAAELSKLADTTYRDVNIAFANELARYAERVGVDVVEAIRAANSQPYSHIHQPGLGVGGALQPGLPAFPARRCSGDGAGRGLEANQRLPVGLAVDALTRQLGSLDGVPVLVLGLTYREGVKELAYSRALPLMRLLAAEDAGVRVGSDAVAGRDRHPLPRRRAGER